MTPPTDSTDVLAGLREFAGWIEERHELPGQPGLRPGTLSLTAHTREEFERLNDVTDDDWSYRIEGDEIVLERSFGPLATVTFYGRAEWVCKRRPVEREEWVLP